MGGVTEIMDKYYCRGWFYTEQQYKFRAYLNIRKRTGRTGKCLQKVKRWLTFDRPDLMVVMMNPGSSVPLEGGDNGRAECKTRPDPTQKQIAIVMEACNFKFARILNLSDRRNPTSNKFLQELEPLNNLGIQHSIFSPETKNRFDELFVQSVPVIFAWGVDGQLKPLARQALESIHSSIRVGQKHTKGDWAYYHARQQGKDPKLWTDKIISQL